MGDLKMSNQTPVSDRCREIILGSLLGDGSIAINKRYKNARFSFRHSASQKEYFFWKVEELKEISGSRMLWKQGKNGSDGFGGEKLRYQSKALGALTEIYNLVTKRGKKRVSRKWLNQLTPLSLAVWWMDDGSLIANSRKGVFCTDGFSCEEVEIIRKYLKKVWNIETKIGRTEGISGRKYYRLYIRSTEELKKFLRIILPYIPVKEMLPKTLLLYKDSQLQQRWISEVVELSKFSRSTVEKYLKIKKSKWQSFRE